MILAAGRGERLRPLTDDCPKPLLQVQGVPLIVWQIRGLARAGFRDLVINVAWLGDQIMSYLGDGSAYGVSIRWSLEARALGTAGGIATAAALLPDRFVVVSADIHTDFDYAQLHAPLDNLGEDGAGRIAHLVLVDAPGYPGDFAVVGDRVAAGPAPLMTYGNIGVFRRRDFAHLAPGQHGELGRLLHAAVARGSVGGQVYSGHWVNVGTASQLAALNGAATSG